MKNLVRIMMVGGLAGTLWSAPALRAEDHAGMKNQDHHQMTADKWKEKLGLSADQAEKLKAAMKAYRDEAQSSRKQLREEMKKLESQITLKYKDSDIQATLDNLKKIHTSMQEQHEKLVSNLNSFLTPTQRGKLLLHMMKHMHGHEMMWSHEGHGHGDHGGPSNMKASPKDEGPKSEEEAE